MLSKIVHEYWVDAKREAILLSMRLGWAWIISAQLQGEQASYRVAVGELQEEAPEGFLSEYKDGVEQ